MARSYLFPGMDVEHLNPQQRQLETLYDRLDRPDHRITPQEFFKTPEYGQFLSYNYGDLASQVPPGSQIINQTPFKLEYRDAQGYTHTLDRSGADAATAGQISHQSDRPPILPNRNQEAFTHTLQQQLQQALTQPAVLAQLDPETKAALAALSTAEQTRNAQAGSDLYNQLVTQLYGNRVNQSSIANELAGRFGQYQGLVNQQQQSDAAQRELQLRQYLTNVGQQQTGLTAGLYGQLSGLGNARDIASAGYGLDAEKIAEQIRQFNKQYGLQEGQLQLGQEQLDLQRSPLAKVGQIANIIGQLTGAASGGLSAYGALLGRPRSTTPIPAPPTPKYFPSSAIFG